MLADMGADVIKVATTGGVLSSRSDPRHAQFRPDELDVLVAEATAAGRFVMAHAQGTQGVKNAIAAGIRSIEHGIFLDDEAIEMMPKPSTTPTEFPTPNPMAITSGTVIGPVVTPALSQPILTNFSEDSRVRTMSSI
jgi:imidazolonepropionase-like amidohydrolase